MSELLLEVHSADPRFADRVSSIVAAAPCRITDDEALADGAIVVVDELDRRTTSRLLEAGAVGIVITKDLEATLPAAVAAASAGLTVVPDGGRGALRRPVLTARQQEIVGLVVLGLPNAVIAQRLFLAESTVKAHLRTIFERLGVRSRKEAIDMVMDPASGLGTGILGFAPGPATADTYAPPRVS